MITTVEVSCLSGTELDKCNRFHRHVMDSGSMSINLKTSTPLPNTVTVIVYATYTKDLIIDGDRVITEAF